MKTRHRNRGGGNLKYFISFFFIIIIDSLLLLYDPSYPIITTPMTPFRSFLPLHYFPCTKCRLELGMQYAFYLRKIIDDYDRR